jgi:fructuronate reductase
MTSLNAAALSRLPKETAPAYDPSTHHSGILHIGVGAFHRAHQAAYTDAALSASGGDWRITGVSLRSTEIADTLNAQDGLFTLVERGTNGAKASVIGAIETVLAAARDVNAVLAEFSKPNIRIVTLTVTEKAYGIDRAANDIDLSHPAIAADLQTPHAPQGVLGILTEGLRLRREALGAQGAMTLLCCDNLPENGHLLRLGVLGFAHRIDANLAAWIEDNVTFPSSMVDRITPAATQATLDIARDLTGFTDPAAIETEPFLQWVIEDDFAAGHPDWAAGGALFVKDVAPYENMKLRMLNGAHSLLAYAGHLSGHVYVRDTMQDAPLKALVNAHMQAAAATLEPLQGINFDQYRSELIDRFINPEIAHETYQIAMDGTQKLQQRIFTPALSALETEQSIETFAFATAAWMRYALGVDENGTPFALRDPQEDAIKSALTGHDGTATTVYNALKKLPDFMPEALRENAVFAASVQRHLHIILNDGIAQAIANFTSEEA